MTLSLSRFDEHRDRAEHCELFRLSFPENAGKAADTDEHYRWKFRDYPATPPSYEYSAREDGKLLGYYAALPYRYRVDGSNLVAGMVCDVMTHPGARGKGVFTTIGRFATEDLGASGLAFTTGYPIRPEVIPGHLKVGWRIVVELPMYLRPLRSKSMLPKFAAPLAPLVDVVLRVGHAIVELPSAGASYESRIASVEELLARDDYPAFVEHAAVPGTNVLDRSRHFMRWRLSAPGTSYRVVIITSNGRLCALAITRAVELRGIATIALLDIMVAERAARGPLHRALIALARADGAEAIVAMASRRAALRLGFAGRFLPTPHVFRLIVKRLSADAPRAIEAAGAWEPMWIDSDDL